MHRFMTCAALLSACLASHAAAGVRITQLNGSDGSGGNHTNEISFDGSRFKSVFVASDNPMMGAGLYVLGPKPNEIYMVNPATRKYARFNPEEMQAMSPQMGDAGGQPEATHADFEAEKQLDEAGPTLVGLPTRHYRYAIRYQETRQPRGAPMKMVSNVEIVNEFWATNAPELATASGWKDPSDESAGDSNAQLQAVEREMAAHGFALKRVVTRKTKMGGMMAMMNMGGDAERTTMEITALDRNASFAPGTFELPKGFAKVDLVNLMTGGAMPDLDAVPGDAPSRAMPDLNDEPRD